MPALPILALLLLSSFEPQGVAERRTLHGTVRDQQGGAITGAALEVTCGSIQRQVYTDMAGEFSVRGLPGERCSVTASSPLFSDQSAEVDLSRAHPAIAFVLQVRGFSTQVVVTPSRGVSEEAFSVPESLSVTTKRDIESRPYQLLPQLLREETGVLVQQTTSAQASPTIRGFTGQANVYLVDGVRLNTAAWRSGPSQYLAWVDPSIAERLEVVRGPGSVEYGSDALGGTINVLSAAPAFSASGIRVGGSAQVAFGSADRSAGGDASLHMRLPRGSLRAGGTRRSIGNLRAGEGIDSHSALTRFLGLPSTAIDTRMRGTDYEQDGATLAGNVNLGAATLNGLFVHSSQTGASRYDRILGGDGNYRSGFDPQRLDFGLLKLQRTDVMGLEGVSATLSMNRQADGRFEQSRPTTRLDEQSATTSVLGYQIQGHRTIASRHRLLAGLELYDERTTAFRRLHEPNGDVRMQRPDIPDGTTYANFGIFAQDSVDFWNGRVNVRGGARYGRFSFQTRADESLGVTAEQVTMDAVTFQVGAVVSLNQHFNLVTNVGHGFRAANAADLGDIGLSGGGGFIITPSKAAALGGLVGSSDSARAVSTGVRVPALGPEVLYSYEAGLKFRSRRVDATVSAYDLEYLDTIQRRAIIFEPGIVGTNISGFDVVRQDSSGVAYIAQDVRPIGTRVNADRARIMGFDLQGNARLSSRWTASANFSMANGRLLKTDEFLRRMPPPIGGARLRWDGRRVWVEGVVSFARTQKRLSSGDLSDARIGALRTRASIANFFNGTASDLGLVSGGILVPTGETLAAVQNRLLGTATSAPVYTTGPGFTVFGLRGGWHVADGVDLFVIGENLTDRNYRFYGSGVDAPGANLQARLRYRF